VRGKSPAKVLPRGTRSGTRDWRARFHYRRGFEESEKFTRNPPDPDYSAALDLSPLTLSAERIDPQRSRTNLLPVRARQACPLRVARVDHVATGWFFSGCDLASPKSSALCCYPLLRFVALKSSSRAIPNSHLALTFLLPRAEITELSSPVRRLVTSAPQKTHRPSITSRFSFLVSLVASAVETMRRNPTDRPTRIASPLTERGASRRTRPDNSAIAIAIAIAQRSA